MTMANTIRTLREMRNWSQEEMANKLNLSKSSYARLETGSSQLKLQHLEKIAEIFDLDITRLLQLGERLDIDIVLGNHPNHGNDYYINYFNYSGQLELEIEKLNLTIQHLKEKLADKEMIIQQKDNEITLLKQLHAVSNTLNPHTNT